jgi:DNA ligase (NAD+)
MDINHLGESTIDKLLDKNLIDNVADLYGLTLDDVLSLEGFKKQSAQNLLDSIQKSKNQDLSRLIYALGIRHVGKYAAQILATHYNSIDKLSRATSEELKEIDGLGEKSAESIATFFATEENIGLIDRLKDIGVRTSQEKQRKDLLFSGKKIIFTGTFEHLSRSQAGDIVKEQGGVIVSSVSKLTDYIIVGKNPGSKYETAIKQGVTILKEEEFIDMIKKKVDTS